MLNTPYDDGERPTTPDPSRVVARGDTCLYFGLEDLDGAYQHWRAQGCDVNEPTCGSCMFAIPTGLGCVYRCRFEAQEQWRKWYGPETTAA